MTNFNESNSGQLYSVNDYLDEKYGKIGSESRKEFDAKAHAYYYGTILRDRRKALKMTQQQLAEQIGTA